MERRIGLGPSLPLDQGRQIYVSKLPLSDTPPNGAKPDGVPNDSSAMRARGRRTLRRGGRRIRCRRRGSKPLLSLRGDLHHGAALALGTQSVVYLGRSNDRGRDRPCSPRDIAHGQRTGGPPWAAAAGPTLHVSGNPAFDGLASRSWQRPRPEMAARRYRRGRGQSLSDVLQTVGMEEPMLWRNLIGPC